MQQKIDISHFTITGDSLTDRGEMSHRYLFGFIPLSRLSGLKGKSPRERFTNRFTWADHFILRVINHLNNQKNPGSSDEILKKHKDAELDDIAAHKKILENNENKKIVENNENGEDTILIESKTFDNYAYIKYDGHKDFVRCYAEGGMSSHDYSWTLSKSITRFFSRLILTNLEEMRERQLNWDHRHKTKPIQKAQTLVIEWSGANDFVTLNEKPSLEEAEQAVRDRIRNVKKLIKKGYRHFELFNLPDLSLTPRFQNENVSVDDRNNATRCTLFFNKELERVCKDLRETYPHCTIEIFDVNTLFKKAFDNPTEYGFKKDKRQNYCDSKDFKNDVNDPVADEYMFWNNIHPSDRMHGLLAKQLNEQLKQKYNWISPTKQTEEILTISPEQLLTSFKKKYKARFTKDLDCFGFFSRSRIDVENASLDDILRHALFEGGNRTRDVIKGLKWINKNGELNLNIQALKDAMSRINSTEDLPEEIEKIGLSS